MMFIPNDDALEAKCKEIFEAVAKAENFKASRTDGEPAVQRQPAAWWLGGAVQSARAWPAPTALVGALGQQLTAQLSRQPRPAVGPHCVQVVGWRDVPVDTSVVGPIALKTMPRIRQVTRRCFCVAGC